MRRYIGILAVILIISCSPDPELVRENGELLKLTAELTEVANRQKNLAVQAAAEARAAEADAMQQARIANEQRIAAEEQVKLRIKEVTELQRKLEKCK